MSSPGARRLRSRSEREKGSTANKSKFDKLRRLRAAGRSAASLSDEEASSDDSAMCLDEDQGGVDDFVVDDDGGGYVEGGDDDIGLEPQTPTKPARTKGAAKMQAKSTGKLQASKERSLGAMFKTAQMKTLGTSKPKRQTDDDAFMTSLMDELETPTTPSKPTKRRQSVVPPDQASSSARRRAAATRGTPVHAATPRLSRPIGVMDISDPKLDPFGPPPVKKMRSDLDDPFQDAPSSPERKPKMEPETVSSEAKVEDAELEDAMLEGLDGLEEVDSAPTLYETTEEPQGQSWMDVQLAMADAVPDNAISSTSQDSATDCLPQTAPADGELLFFWLDMLEKNGSLYIIGKTPRGAGGELESCCLKVTGIERNVFLLPRAQGAEGERISVQQVHQEFEGVAVKHGVRRFMCKAVTRHYAFEADVPATAEYLKVAYGFDQPVLPAGLSGSTFERAFGTTYSAQELFLLKRRLMGPCWLVVRGALAVDAHSRQSWCRREFVVGDAKTVRVADDDTVARARLPRTPALTTLALNLRTVASRGAAEIVAASVLVHRGAALDDATPAAQRAGEQLTLVRALSGQPLPADFARAAAQQARRGMRVEPVASEAALVARLVELVHMADADVLVAHNFYGFALDVLLSRMRALRTADWSRLGRLQRAQLPRPGDAFGARQAVAGRVVCDTYLASRDLVRAHSYSLGSLARQELGIRREDIAPDRVSDHFAAAKPLLHLLRHAAFDAFLATALMVHLHVLPLTLQLTTLAGNLWSRTLMGARAERNEHLLLHEFYRAKFIRPDRRSSRAAVSDDDAAPARRKPAYLGGLVLEPQRGFYDRFVLLLDFNSLYPSIIQEFNICFTTVRPGAADAVPEPPEPSEPQGVLPRLLKTLVDRRRQVKQLLAAAAPAEREQLDVRQRALKLTANSMYGCLGFTHSRFYAKPLAMLITARGREILQATRDLALADGLEVIYGDTDSLMIATRATSLADVYALGSRFRRRVNERYRLLELGIDAVFRRLLLLKKKKYAALVISDAGPSAEPKTELETKGLDLVRRDWCGLSHDVSDYVLRLLFAEPDTLDSSHSSDHNGQSPDHDQNSALALIHDHLTRVAAAVRARQVPLDKYAIHKGLTKPPEAYTDRKGQPHVMVALRMRGSGHTVRAGDTVPYVICDAQSPALLRDAADQQQLATGSFADRARHPDEVRDSAGQLFPDAEWYLNQQVLPPCARLLEPLQATDMATLAQCLGLDAAKYRAASASAAGSAYSADSLRTLDSQISDTERFRYAQSFVANCPLCDKEYHVDGIARKAGDHFESGLLCSHCNGLPSPGSLATQLAIQIRRHIHQYYEFVLQCDEPDCALQTKLLSVVGTRCSRPGCSGKLHETYSDKALYVQIQYFASLLSVDRSATRLETSASAIIQFRDSHPEHIAKLLAVVESYLAVSARRFVDLSSLFSFCRL